MTSDGVGGEENEEGAETKRRGEIISDLDCALKLRCAAGEVSKFDVELVRRGLVQW